MIKKCKKILSLVLVLSLILSSTSVVYAKAKDKDNPEQVLGYMNNVPIYQEDINENGKVINEEKLGLIFQTNTNKNVAMSSADNIFYVPEGTNFYIEKVLTAPSFSQTTYDNYLTPMAARDYATEMQTGTITAIAVGLAGLFSGPSGAYATIAGLLYGLRNAAIVDDIRSYADDEIPVFVRVVESRYSTLYAINEWDGTSVDLSVHESTSTSEEIVQMYFQ